MKRQTAILLTGLLSAGPLASNAHAQNLNAYQTLANELDAAEQTAGKNALQTLSHLDAATKALDQLAPTITNPKLAGGLRDALDAARAAQSRTPAELQAQVILMRGLMRKALYDQTVTALATSPANGMERLNVLAKELGADAQALSADAKEGKLNLVAWRLQKTAAAKVSAALNGVEAKQTPTSYLNLARATSWFTVVQEAGRALNPSLDVPEFQRALTQLAAGNTAELGHSLTTLKTGVKNLNASLATVPTAVTTRTTTQNLTPVVVNGQKPASNNTSAPKVNNAAAGTSTAGGVGTAYAALGRALTASGHADMETARTELSLVPSALASAPSALRSAAGYDAFISHVQGMANRKGLRPTDVQALIAELGSLEQKAKGQTTSTLDSLSGASARSFGGGLRAILALLVALACAAPLYLLNLAFGGRNPFWRAISIALGLLLLPAFLEGVFGFLGWIGDLVNVPFLRSLTNLTLLQGAYAFPWQGLLYIAAIALATYGFRGLCEQFGLLGGRPAKKVNREAVATAQNPTQTSFDWDEEV